MGRSLLGADQQLNLALGIDIHSESPLTPGCDRLVERRCGRFKAIGGTGRVSNRRGDDLKNLFRGLKIRRAEGKINQRENPGSPSVDLFGLVGPSKNAVAESLQSPRGWHPGKLAAGAWQSPPHDGRPPLHRDKE